MAINRKRNRTEEMARYHKQAARRAKRSHSESPILLTKKQVEELQAAQMEAIQAQREAEKELRETEDDD